ncbi:MAG: alpha/beta fold hydrolase [Nitrospirae bacterium]|nr:alpha/beta fold hydrolase [Nitrospirota bacterium]
MTPRPLPEGTQHLTLPVPGARLHLAGITPDGAGRGLFLLPGYTDHLERYGELFAFFAGRGLAVWAMDPRGHGRSSGLRGRLGRFEEYLDDLHQALATARERSGVARWALLGHSTGGLVALSSLIRRPAALARWGVERVAVTSPLLAIRLPVPPLRRRLGELVSGALPWLSLPAGGGDYANSHDPEQEARRRADPLIFKWVNVRWFTEVCREMAFVNAHAADVDLPLLCLQAGADRVVAPAAARAWCARCPAATYREYPEMFHEVLLETERRAVFADLAAWLKADSPG